MRVKPDKKGIVQPQDTPTDSQSISAADLLRELASLRQAVAKLAPPDGWLDAKGAAAYLCMSANTFDKHRYSEAPAPRIEGHRVGGKWLYHRDDLDTFVRLFDLRDRGLA
jgi:hypothetical protein